MLFALLASLRRREGAKSYVERQNGKMSCGRIADDATDVEPQFPIPRLVKQPRCSSAKCPSEGRVDLVVRNVPYCQACFLAQMTNKFNQGLKSTIQRCRPLKGLTEPGSITVAFSGGPASSALLYLLRRRREALEARSVQARKGTSEYKRIDVVHISHGSADPNSAKDDELCRIYAEKQGFQLNVVPLDNLFSTTTDPLLQMDLRDPTLPVASCSHSSSSTTTPLQQLLSPLSPTSRVALLDQLTSSLLIHLASAAAAPFSPDRPPILLRGDTTTRIAIRTLSGVAMGRGWGLGSEVKAEVIVDGVVVVRPLAMATLVETLHFLSFNSLTPPLGSPVLPTSLDAALEREKKEDVPGLLEDFILGLDAGFPMTSATVARTAEKLRSRGGGVESACVVCGLPADPDADAWRHAISVTPRAVPPAAPGQSTDGTSQSDTGASLLPLACYACLAVLRDVRPAALKDATQGTVPLPAHVQKSISARRSTAAELHDDQPDGINGHASSDGLRKQIEEYLL